MRSRFTLTPDSRKLTRPTDPVNQIANLLNRHFRERVSESMSERTRPEHSTFG